MYDSTIFNRYINEIGDPKIQEIVEECLQKCPKEFYTMPASTTGKYHPPFALGEGGLVRHTLAACCWAKDLLQLEQYSILLPKSDIQQFVHLCDYLASRKGDPDVYINSSAGSEQEI